MDEIFGGYVVSFNARNDVRILDNCMTIPLNENELHITQAVTLNAMIIRMYALMRPHWQNEFIETLAQVEEFAEQGDFDLWNVTEPEEVREYKKGFAYRCVKSDGMPGLMGNNQAWGFGVLGKNIEEYSMLACIYVVCYLILKNESNDHKNALNGMLADMRDFLVTNVINVETEVFESEAIALKHFST